METKHLHYEVLAYSSSNEETGACIGAITIEVQDCTTEEEAIEKAKCLAVRPYYMVRKVWECYSCNRAKEQVATQHFLASLLKKHIAE
jgi:hypothetical protein